MGVAVRHGFACNWGCFIARDNNIVADFHGAFAIDNGIAVRGCQPVSLSFVVLLVIAVAFDSRRLIVRKLLLLLLIRV